jgi:hypothetical protein
MRHAVLALSLLTAAPACVRDDGRGTMSSTTVEANPEVAKVAVSVATIALCVGFLLLQAK